MLPGGEEVELVPLAERVTDRHLERHPEDVEVYGEELARQWGVHDNQHILLWAIEDRDLAGQLAWLAGVLGARGYPVPNLIDNVRGAAGILEQELPAPHGAAVAERMRAAAAAVEG
jgi:hypothetical protein